MKKLLTLSSAILLLFFGAFAQPGSKYQIKTDTVVIKGRDGQPTGGELKIENSTKGLTNAFLMNAGGGITRFEKVLSKVNDYTYLVGKDTLNILTGQYVDSIFTKLDSIVYYKNNVRIAKKILVSGTGGGGGGPGISQLGNGWGLKLKNDSTYEVDSSKLATKWQQEKTRDSILAVLISKADSSTVWKIGGNYNINSSHFIGPINKIPLRFKINGYQVGVIAADSSVMNPRYSVGFGHRALENHTFANGSNIAIGAYSMASLTNGGGSIAIGNNTLQNLTTGGSVIAIGQNSMRYSTGNNNIGIGGATLQSATGILNIAIGSQSMVQLQGGSYNITMGTSTLSTAKAANRTIAIGDNALNKVRSSDNIAIGYYALANLDSLTKDLGIADFNNLAIGNWAMTSTTTGNRSTAVGHRALETNTTGSINTAVGEKSMLYNTTGSQNVGVGVNSLMFNSTGIKNVALGAGAMETNETGSFNIGVGVDALLRNSTGSGNIGIGWNGFANNYTGNNNIGIGYGSGKSVVNGDFNVFIGRDAGWMSGQKDTIFSSIAIGHQAYTKEDSTAVFGGDYIKKTRLKGILIDTTYGSGLITGTAAYHLAVNSSGQFIEVANPITELSKGTTSISNSSSTRILYDSLGKVSNENNFKWDFDNNRLEIIGEMRAYDPTNSTRGYRISHDPMGNAVSIQAWGTVNMLSISGFPITSISNELRAANFSAVTITTGPGTTSLTPLKFITTAAVLNTTPVAGAMEVLVDSIYYTGAGGVRKRLAFANEIIGGGSGVTSVATNTSTGITGGTITSIGTLAIDTSLISTRLWRQKGIDSLQNNITIGLASKQATLVSGANIKTVNGNSLLGSGDLAISGMIYPGAGIPVSTGSAWGTSITDNSSNWNTAFSWGNHSGLYFSLTDTASKTWAWTDITGKPVILSPTDTTGKWIGIGWLSNLMKYSDTASKTWDWADITGKPSVTTWDGGSTGLVASTGRNSLGGTTVGQNLFTLTNPSAISFLRVNADNSVSTLDASTMLSALSGTPTTRTISTTGPLSGGGDLSTNRTLSIANAAADGTTKGAASFTANDFDATTGNISIDYINGQKATKTQPGFATAAQIARLDSNSYVVEGEGIGIDQINDSTQRYRLKYDTVALATFGAGAGLAGDTAAFSTSSIYGSFYNDGSDSLMITKMLIGLQGTSPNITFEVFYNDSLNVSAGATKLVNAGSNATNIYGGTSVTSFNNSKIPPGNWVWVKSSAVTTKPTYFGLTLIGYKKRVNP